MITKLARYIAGLPSAKRSALEALVTATVFYFGAYLSTSISNAAILPSNYGLAIHATVFVVLLFIVVFLSRAIERRLHQLEQEKELEKTTISRAYALCDKILTERSHRLESDGNKDTRLLEQLGLSIKNIQGFIDSAYNTFESTYGKSSISSDRIDFEVTFMTRSFVDSYITIPAAANRDGRQPRSMILRKDNPDIYSNTVTASVYKMTSPHMVIIEDTSNPISQYQELYPSQTDRIKSSLIYPVFSNQNRLLGTIVVHCDKNGFFKHDKKKYWVDMLEIFSKKIAYEVLKIEAMHAIAQDTNTINIQAKYVPPY